MLEFTKVIAFRIRTMLGCWCSSPIRTAWFISGSSRGMIDSHSFNCAASSITKMSSGLISRECSIKEPEAVDNINDAVCKQNSLIDFSVTTSGSFCLPSET